MEEDDVSSPTPYWTSATSTGILLATSGPYVERIFQVGPAGGLIGRSRKCTISLLHDCEVSHNHALLELYHGHLCIRDVGSTFGTYLNDKRLSEPKRASEAHKLKACDAIKVGQTSLRWRPLPVIRASLAVTVPASVRLLAEQCAALAEHAVALSPVDLRRDPGTPALAQRALGWPGVAGLPPTATGPASSAAGAASPAAAAAAAALEDFSRRSLSPVPNDTGGGSAHPTLDSNPDLGSPPFLGSAPILGSSSNLFSAPSLGFHPNLGSNVSFDTLPAPGAMASPPAHAGATGVAGAAGGEDRGSGTGAEGSGVGPGSRGGGVGGGAGDAGGSGAGAAASGAGGGSGGGGLELFHRAGANETHQRLLLALRTLYLRHQDSLTHLRKTAVTVDLPCAYRRLELLQSVAAHAARHAASLRSAPVREPVGLSRAATIVASVLSGTAAGGAGGAGGAGAAAGGGAAAGAVSLEMYAAEPEVARLHELARELQLLRQDTLFYFEDALKTLAAFTHAQRYHARALQAEEVRGLVLPILAAPETAGNNAAATATAGGTSIPVNVGSSSSSPVPSPANVSIPGIASPAGGVSGPPGGIEGLGPSVPPRGIESPAAMPPSAAASSGFSAAARSAACLIHGWLAQADAASDRMLVAVFTCERWLGTAEALVRAPGEDRPSELPALMRQRRQLRSQLAVLCAIPTSPAPLAKASDTSAASLSAAASEAASPIALRPVSLTPAHPRPGGLRSSLIPLAGPPPDTDWPLPSPGLLRPHHTTAAAAAAAARQRWEVALRQLHLEREVARVDAHIERLLRRAPHAPTLEERVGLLPELPPLVAELEAEAAAAAESSQIDDGAGRCARRRIGAAALGLMGAPVSGGGGGGAVGGSAGGAGGRGGSMESVSPQGRRGRRLVSPCGPSCRGGARRLLLHSLMLLNPSPGPALLAAACGSAAVDPTEVEAECDAECTYRGGMEQLATTADASVGGVPSSGPADHYCCARHFAVAPTLLCYDSAGGVAASGAPVAGSWRVDTSATRAGPGGGSVEAPAVASNSAAVHHGWGGGAATRHPSSVDEANRNVPDGISFTAHGASFTAHGASFTALLDAEPCALRVWRMHSAAAAAAGLAALRARAQCTGPSLLGVSYSWSEAATPETEAWLQQLSAAGGGEGGGSEAGGGRTGGGEAGGRWGGSRTYTGGGHTDPPSGGWLLCAQLGTCNAVLPPPGGIPHLPAGAQLQQGALELVQALSALHRHGLSCAGRITPSDVLAISHPTHPSASRTSFAPSHPTSPVAALAGSNDTLSPELRWSGAPAAAPTLSPLIPPAVLPSFSIPSTPRPPHPSRLLLSCLRAAPAREGHFAADVAALGAILRSLRDAGIADAPNSDSMPSPSVAHAHSFPGHPHPAHAPFSPSIPPALPTPGISFARAPLGILFSSAPYVLTPDQSTPFDALILSMRDSCPGRRPAAATLASHPALHTPSTTISTPPTGGPEAQARAVWSAVWAWRDAAAAALPPLTVILPWGAANWEATGSNAACNGGDGGSCWGTGDGDGGSGGSSCWGSVGDRGGAGGGEGGGGAGGGDSGGDGGSGGAGATGTSPVSTIELRAGSHGRNGAAAGGNTEGEPNAAIAGGNTGGGPGTLPAKPADLVDTLLGLPALLASAAAGASPATRSLAPFRPFTLVLDRSAEATADPRAPHPEGTAADTTNTGIPRREVCLASLMDAFWRRVLLHRSRPTTDGAAEELAFPTENSLAAATSSEALGGGVAAAPTELAGGRAPLLDLPPSTAALGPLAALPPPMPLPPADDAYADIAGGPYADTAGGAYADTAGGGQHPDPAAPASTTTASTSLSLESQRDLGRLLLVCIASGVPLPAWLAPSTFRALLGHGLACGLDDLAAARPQLATRYALFLASVGGEADWPDSEAPPPPPAPRLFTAPATAASAAQPATPIPPGAAPPATSLPTGTATLLPAASQPSGAASLPPGIASAASAASSLPLDVAALDAGVNALHISAAPDVTAQPPGTSHPEERLGEVNNNNSGTPACSVPGGGVVRSEAPSGTAHPEEGLGGGGQENGGTTHHGDVSRAEAPIGGGVENKGAPACSVSGGGTARPEARAGGEEQNSRSRACSLSGNGVARSEERLGGGLLSSGQGGIRPSLSASGSGVSRANAPANSGGGENSGTSAFSASGGGVALSATSPKLLDVFRAVCWRLHGCRAKACDELASGFHMDLPASISEAIRAASCEGLMLAAAGCGPLPSSSLESRLVFESWPDGSATPRLLCHLLRSETDSFRRRFILLITGRTALPHPQPESWEGAAAARHTGSLSANGRRHHPGRGGGGLPRGAVAPGMLVIRYQVPPPGGPPPPRVLRSAWVMLLTEMLDATTLRAAIVAALARSPEARWGDDDTWLVPIAPAEKRRAGQ